MSGTLTPTPGQTAPTPSGEHTSNAGDGETAATAPPATGTATPPAGGAERPVNEHGYPDATPVADMTQEQQTAYWKFHARKHETRAQQHAAELEQLRTATPPAQDPATGTSPEQVQQMITEAVETARAEERRTASLELARTSVSAALASVIPEEDKRGRVLAGLDPAAFLSDTGTVDADKVTAFAETFTPSAPDSTRHMGSRRSSGSTGVDAGAAMYADKHTK